MFVFFSLWHMHITILVSVTDLSIKLLDLRNYLVASKYVINTLLVHVIGFSYYLLTASAASIFIPPQLHSSCAGSQEGPPCPGVHRAWYCQWAKGKDCPALLCCCLTLSTVRSDGCHDVRRI